MDWRREKREGGRERKRNAGKIRSEVKERKKSDSHPYVQMK